MLFQGRQFCQNNFCAPSEKGSTLKGIAPFVSKFFSFREDPFSEVDWCAENQPGSLKSCLPYKVAENLQFVSSLLNLCHAE